MATWPVTAVRIAQPHATIDWVVESGCQAMVDTERLVSERLVFPRDRWKKRRWSPAMWRDQMVHYARLRGRSYDYGLDLQGHSKTALALRIASPKRRLSVAATDAFAKSLNPVASIDPLVTHVVDRHMAALRTWLDLPTPTGPIMPESPETLKEFGLPDRFITVMTGASSDVKRIPDALLEGLVKRLIASGHQVILIGGPNDPRPTVSGAIDLVGKTSLPATLELVRRSELHIAADTGTGHMAAAYGVPVLSVFGNRPHAIDRFRPYTDKLQVVTWAPDALAPPVDTFFEKAEILLSMNESTNSAL